MNILCRMKCGKCGWESDWFIPSVGHKPSHFCIDREKEKKANELLDEFGLKPKTADSPLQSQVGGDHSAEGPTPSRYRWSWNGVTFDFYRLCDILGIRHHAQAHALKKLIRAGRSVKSLEQDLDETIDAILRWKEMIREDRQSADPEETK